MTRTLKAEVERLRGAHAAEVAAWKSHVAETENLLAEAMNLLTEARALACRASAEQGGSRQ